MQPALHAPWRMDYIQSLQGPPGGAPCFLCQAAATPDDPNCLVLWQTAHSVVLINRYPYANGHLLVAPKAHKDDLGLLEEAELLDLGRQTARATALLRRAVSAQGFNLGINLGHCAGAGLPGHLHQHIVPRWSGDTNFMSVVGDVRVIPQAIGRLHQLLREEVGKLSTTDERG